MNEGVSQTYSVVVIGVVSLISEAVTVAALTTVLLLVDPVPAVAAIAYFITTGFAFDRLVRSRATSAGQSFQVAALAMSTTVFETLHGIKEVKVRRTSAFFLDKYAAQRLRYARSRRMHVVPQRAPTLRVRARVRGWCRPARRSSPSPRVTLQPP